MAEQEWKLFAYIFASCKIRRITEDESVPDATFADRLWVSELISSIILLFFCNPECLVMRRKRNIIYKIIYVLFWRLFNNLLEPIYIISQLFFFWDIIRQRICNMWKEANKWQLEEISRARKYFFLRDSELQQIILLLNLLLSVEKSFSNLIQFYWKLSSTSQTQLIK